MPIDTLNNIFPYLTYVVDRNCTASWKLDNRMGHYNIMFLYEGEARFERNDEVYIAKKGDFVFYRPNDIRKARTFPDRLMKCYAVDFLYTCVEFDKVEWKLKHCELPFKVVSTVSDPYLYSKLVDLFSSLSRLWMNNKQNNEVKSRSIFAEIIHLLLRYNECKSYSFSDAKRAEEVINYLTKHYAERITLEDLSEKMQLSYSYLGSIFKKVTGKPIIEYLIHIRLYKAKELLRDGHSVSDVAYMTGFNDVFYFSKVFKKYENISPSQYRRENINK